MSIVRRKLDSSITSQVSKYSCEEKYHSRKVFITTYDLLTGCPESGSQLTPLLEKQEYS